MLINNITFDFPKNKLYTIFYHKPLSTINVVGLGCGSCQNSETKIIMCPHRRKICSAFAAPLETKKYMISNIGIHGYLKGHQNIKNKLDWI